MIARASGDGPGPVSGIRPSGPYAHELAVACEAALDAGEILLRAFLAPGGAPGNGGKSPADDESERLIRGRIGAAFPDDGIRGEELPRMDKAPSAPSGRRWLVDPNDGTDAFLKGRRGAAVSIALLEGDLPVLGVVFAYAARSGFGDMFSWAAGRPLVRNGEELPRRERGSLRVSGRPVALVSGGSDTASAVNAPLCEPALFRAEPSIAWRLALVAAGEADVAISIYNPSDYDVAAGHALLMGAGLDLFRAGGAPVRYGPAYGRVGDCFGGDAALAGLLAGRDWAPSRNARHSRGDPLGLVRSEKTLVWTGDPRVLDRAVGCLLGFVMGDHLALRSGESPPVKADARDRPLDGENRMAGQGGRASEIALTFARAIAEAGCPDSRAAEAALPAIDLAERASMDTATALAIPLALWAGGSGRVDTDGLARGRDGGSGIGIDAARACAFIAGNLSRLIADGRGMAVETGADPVGCADFFVGIAGRSGFAGGMGGADGDAHAFRHAFVDALDRDPDRAALAGACLGAFFGWERFPPPWRAALLTARPLAGTPAPRPHRHWTVDGPRLAERLITLGSRER